MKKAAPKPKRPKGQPKPATAPTGDISATFNMLKRKGNPKLSIAQIKQVTSRAWAKAR